MSQTSATDPLSFVGMATRSRANPGGNQNVLEVLGPDVLPLRARKPAWFKVPAPGSPRYRQLRGLIESENLHTVCQEAACPNIGECWQRGTATFMILGDTCTRRCGFCNVKTGKPTWNDPLEPARVARSVAPWGSRHAVITSVDRDDLPDLWGIGFCRGHQADKAPSAAVQGRGAHARLSRRGDATRQGHRRTPRRVQPQRRGGAASLPPGKTRLQVRQILPGAAERERDRRRSNNHQVRASWSASASRSARWSTRSEGSATTTSRS